VEIPSITVAYSEDLRLLLEGYLGPQSVFTEEGRGSGR
jgi:hypothetical protein